MEHASAGAGADNNPVIRGMTDVLSCPRVQSQHFWDGLRKKQLHQQDMYILDDKERPKGRCRQCMLSLPHLLLKRTTDNSTAQPGGDGICTDLTAHRSIHIFPLIIYTVN